MAWGRDYQGACVHLGTFQGTAPGCPINGLRSCLPLSRTSAGRELRKRRRPSAVGPRTNRTGPGEPASCGRTMRLSATERCKHSREHHAGNIKADNRTRLVKVSLEVGTGRRPAAFRSIHLYHPPTPAYFLPRSTLPRPHCCCREAGSTCVGSAPTPEVRNPEGHRRKPSRPPVRRSDDDKENNFFVAGLLCLLSPMLALPIADFDAAALLFGVGHFCCCCLS